MKLEKDGIYVTRTLEVVYRIQKNGLYYIGKLLEAKDWTLEFKSNGECTTFANKQSIIEKVTANQLEHGIYSDLELSIIRDKEKIGTCTIHGVRSAIQLKIKTKKDKLIFCLDGIKPF